MHTPVQHLYKQLNGSKGLLYAWFQSMHTRVDIVLCNKPEKILIHIIYQIYETLRQLEKTANFYDPASELSKVNNSAAEKQMDMSNELYAMINMCVDYHAKTLCCFDITIQSDNYGEKTLSSILLSPENQNVFYKQKGIKIDLSGFLKGYALEKTRTILQHYEVENALINMGNSSILALGNHPFGNGWSVGFDRPLDAEIRTPEKNSVTLHNQCLTISGNDTNEHKHIVSPQSGKWIEGAKRIGVVTDNGAIGEILSTSLFVATPLQRERLVDVFGITEIYDL